ncbi:MAG TPA: hypothetical protein VFV99_10450 [Kofleriaceae bacterium]|nr:hypothetical protein [Kofleriaceae bacterium]
MGARSSCLLVLLSACGFSHGVDPGNNTIIDSGLTVDVPEGFMFMDAPIDARQCYGTFENICLTELPTTDLVLDTNKEVNTDTGCPYVFTQSSGQSLCGLVYTDITINARLRALGPRPLVVIATGTFKISATGLVDVGSYKEISGPSTTEIIGAGAATGATLCGNPSSGANDSGMGTVGAGGGAGGSFGGKGGNGARGASNSGGNGGNASNASATPSFMRGGCRGTSGGSGNMHQPGAGGAGGGAVYLIAGTSIDNQGHIRAGGMGGYGGDTESGGGGGGAGGMIVLDAPTITNSGILNANGGGAGEGGGADSGPGPGGGSRGEQGSSALTGTGAADGGNMETNGGNGGPGSWATASGGTTGSTAANGGGGGGGGAGVIRIYPTQTLAGTISPDPS